VKLRRLPLLLGGILAILLALLAGWMLWITNPGRGLPYSSGFDKQEATEWTSFGGTWSVRDGIMRNSSDERGSKLVTGSTYWRNYVLEADLRFLGISGDVGLISRSGNEETGVDAYNGYYVGLRSFDNSLVIGRADYGWSEARPVPAPSPLQPLKWFHLKIVNLNCTIAASAQDILTGQTSYVAIEESQCVPSGRIGLRSLATGGEWRNVSARPATQADAESILRHVHKIEQPLYPRTEAEYNGITSFLATPQLNESSTNPDAMTIESLRAADNSQARQVDVRGVVTLLRPELFVQDVTGGVAVQMQEHSQPILNLGDEVEVQGMIGPRRRDQTSVVTIRNATIHLLWDRSPISPLAINALQGTTADVAGMLVEMQGEVSAEREEAGKLVINLESGTQAFRAIVDKPAGGLHVPMLAPHSLVRVRGISVTDERYTKRLTPFVLLLRSTDDIDQIAGAPWWSARHLLQETIVALLVLILLQAYHGHMQQQRRAAITGERERMAHELHDTLAQTFAGLAFQLHGIRNRLRLRERAPFDMVNQQLDATSDFVRRTHQEASFSIDMLRSQSPEVGDLATALERSAGELTPPGVATVRIVGESTGYAMPLRTTDALFHIGREALVNAARHAGAQKIDITITFERKRLSLEIADNGSGFLRDPVCQRFGLKGMERRAAAIHATFQLETKLGEGTKVRVVAPVPHRGRLFGIGRRATRSGA